MDDTNAGEDETVVDDDQGNGKSRPDATEKIVTKTNQLTGSQYYLTSSASYDLEQISVESHCQHLSSNHEVCSSG